MDIFNFRGGVLVIPPCLPSYLKVRINGISYQQINTYEQQLEKQLLNEIGSLSKVLCIYERKKMRKLSTYLL